MENSMSDRWFDFSDEDISVLCRYSDKSKWDYYNSIVEHRKYIMGLFYEIKQVAGNWTFKDRVLPGLFQELLEQLEKVLKCIEEHDGEEFQKLDYYLYSKRHQSSQTRYFLLQYLIQKFKKEFIDYGEKELSRKYTHLWLNKLIKKSSIRIKNVLDEYKDYTHELCKEYAKEGIKRLVMKRLEYKKKPLLGNPEMLASSYGHEDLQEHLEKCFRPSVGNCEYWLGLAPIWEDQCAAYYFSYEHDSSARAIVLIVERAKPPIIASDGIPYYQSGAPIIEWFEQINAKEKFLDWFNDDRVKERLIWHFFSRIFYRYLKYKEDLTEELYQDSYQQVHDLIELCTTYYGIFYPIEEVIELSKKKELEVLENRNLIEEEKQRQREVIAKMFPAPKDKIVEEVAESS